MRSKLLSQKPRAKLAGLIVVAAVVLSGCSTERSSFRETLGLDKAPPDEFLVVTKAPLILPPGSDLVPPDPGAPAQTANNPTIAAETAVFGARRTSAASSKGESTLLSRAGVGSADPRIRRRLRAEELRAEEASDTVANQILDIQRDEAETLDPNEEKILLRKKQTGRRISAEDILNSSR